MIKSFIISFVLASCLLVQAQDETVKKKKAANDEELVVTSEQLESDLVQNISIFTHNVKAINGETTMTADKMTCYLDKKNDPYLIIAEGNVIIIKGKQRAIAGKAVYKLKEEIIILKFKPELFDGNNNIKARIITFYETKKISEYNDPVVLLIREKEGTLKPKTKDTLKPTK
jgi:lipopolysaccharide transport protein LptA